MSTTTSLFNQLPPLLFLLRTIFENRNLWRVGEIMFTPTDCFILGMDWIGLDWMLLCLPSFLPASQSVCLPLIQFDCYHSELPMKFECDDIHATKRIHQSSLPSMFWFSFSPTTTLGRCCLTLGLFLVN